MSGPIWSPWDTDYTPLDDIDEREWLAQEEAERRAESEATDE